MIVAPQASLPRYSNAYLGVLDADALIDLLIGDEDRVPRNVIDAAARLGQSMETALRRRLAGPWDPSHEGGEWWLRLHAAMILGLMEHEGAGSLLVDCMRRMALAEDDDLQDCLSDAWPALFANKPANVLGDVRDLCLDRSLDWYVRSNALGVVIAGAARRGGESLERALDWAADRANDESEDEAMRVWFADALVDYPRERHRPVLERYAAPDADPAAAVFTADEVRRAYAGELGKRSPDGFDDPWRFYSPEAIRERQARWARAEQDEEADPLERTGVVSEPYIRELPKIGRNDPCPCGSGRKFKKCCLPNSQE